jgi:hypothetical protein
MAAEWLKKLFGYYPTRASEHGLPGKNIPLGNEWMGILALVEFEQLYLCTRLLPILHHAEFAQTWPAPPAGR